MNERSLGDVFRRSCRTWPDKTAMLYPEGREFRALTYRELEVKIRIVAQALTHRGLRRGDRVCLQAENCVEWAWLDWACHSLGLVLVPIYSTLPKDQTEFIVRDCGAQLMVSSSADQQKKVADLDVQKTLLNELTANPDPMDASTWDSHVDAAQLDDLCTIIYTSGTTGNPKGVMLPNRAPIHVAYYAKRDLPITHDDTFLTFLPMSHVYERVAGQVLAIYLGATLGYAKSLASLSNDLMALRPTILLCVPRFLEATMDKIVDNVKKAPPIRQKLFALAQLQGLAKLEGKFAPLAGLMDKLVGAKIRARTGGRIRLFVSGGAALPDHVARFYMAFNMTVLQGYGLTESAGGTCVNHPDRNKYWTVGESLGMEIRIADDGEILLRGGGLMLGYYNNPQATAEAIDAEGWFHTGDIGEFEGKNLKITDRKKDILVLANGKNVAPQGIENKLKQSPFIQEAVLFGDGNEYVYALIVPSFERVRAAVPGLPEDDQKLIEHDGVLSMIRKEIQGINQSLADFEKVKRHALLPKMFTIDSGELTPSMKVKRKVVRERYRTVLESLERP